VRIVLETPIRIAAQQHQVIRDRLRALEPDLDEETLADTLEGLTDLHEMLAAIIRAALDDEALAEGLKDRMATMERRLQRFQERASKRRQIAREVMVETEIKKITAPDFTISIRPGSPALVVMDETGIPEQFWEPRSPRLNRQALLSELKQGTPIDGVVLSNPEPVLSVRTK
jgi:hypothetical protein